MAERPILFTGPMVRAILEGHKTQTRRIVKPPRRKIAIWDSPDSWFVDPGGTIFGPGPYVKMDWWHTADMPADFDPDIVTAAHTAYRRMDRVRCPYDYPEDGARLWVRESFAVMDADYRWLTRREAKGQVWPHVAYKADGIPRNGDGEPAHPPHWSPSIHMPRWASRFTLRINEVRCERLQAISDEDMRAEGIGKNVTREALAAYWDKLNDRPRRRWADDPMVWVLCFERVPQDNMAEL